MSLVSDLAAICNVPPKQAVRMIAALEKLGGAPMFMGTPDRWYEDLHYRCENGHVSTMVLRCEEGPRDQCLAAGCRARCFITFPEDVE